MRKLPTRLICLILDHKLGICGHRYDIMKPSLGSIRVVALSLFSGALLLFVSGAAPAFADSPKANSSATVVFNKARFTLLTPQLIRMEFSDAGEFEDRASLVVINRELPVPVFNQKITGKRLNLTTEFISLTYVDDGKKFSASNLNLIIKTPLRSIKWHPELSDDKNLKGTLRTLDQADGWNFESRLELGILSRNGWSLLDDSQTNLFDGDINWNWVIPRKVEKGQYQDWYLFAHGDNYRKALYDFSLVAGKIPMPPKYALGYWWSRYWIYNDSELRELANQFREYQIPHDVLIIDMDWHETYGFSGNHPERDSQGELKGWTGYTWNKNLFPYPEKFIEWTNQQNLKTALNLHPASGVPTMEEKYAEFAQAYGFNQPNEYIPYRMSEKKWAEIYFNLLLKPMEKWGIDFWWLDWQQALYDKSIPSLSNTWWLNYTFFTHMEKSANRPMIFHRWGGLGNHRYPIGFSGDAHTNWETLDFETYFTATAANVGYGYWSHDIGGHISNGKPTDGELYLRWIQFGAFSPILRTHSSKISLIERRPWMFPQHFVAMRDAIKLRYALVPYLYAAARKTYETGVAFIHPLYYDNANSPQAYSYKTQYCVGDEMIVAPITTPIDPSSRLAEKKIWLPKGEWFEYSSGSLLKGNAELTRTYALDEIPLFIKAGSIIPMYPEVGNLQQRIDKLILTIIPGSGGQTTLYDDDQTTSLYQQNQFTQRMIKSKELSENSLNLVIDAAQNSFANMPTEQTFDLRLVNRVLPSTIVINGEIRNLSVEFDAKNLSTVIHLPPMPVSQKISMQIHFAQTFTQQNSVFNANKGFLRRVASASEILKYASALTDWGGTLPNSIHALSNVSNQLIYEPENTFALLNNLNNKKREAGLDVERISNLPTETKRSVIQFLEL